MKLTDETGETRLSANFTSKHIFFHGCQTSSKQKHDGSYYIIDKLNIFFHKSKGENNQIKAIKCVIDTFKWPTQFIIDEFSLKISTKCTNIIDQRGEVVLKELDVCVCDTIEIVE